MFVGSRECDPYLHSFPGKTWIAPQESWVHPQPVGHKETQISHDQGSPWSYLTSDVLYDMQNNYYQLKGCNVNMDFTFCFVSMLTNATTLYFVCGNCPCLSHTVPVWFVKLVVMEVVPRVLDSQWYGAAQTKAPAQKIWLERWIGCQTGSKLTFDWDQYIIQTYFWVHTDQYVAFGIVTTPLSL